MAAPGLANLFESGETVLNFETFVSRFQQRFTASLDDILTEYLRDFFSKCDKGAAPGMAAQVTKAGLHLFEVCFGGKGPDVHSMLSMVREIYGLRCFHRFLGRDGAFEVLQPHADLRGERGQYVFRWSEAHLKEGYLTLDALRADESGRYSALVKYSALHRGWIVGNGKEGNDLKVYPTLSDIGEQNRNALRYPITPQPPSSQLANGPRYRSNWRGPNALTSSQTGHRPSGFDDEHTVPTGAIQHGMQGLRVDSDDESDFVEGKTTTRSFLPRCEGSTETPPTPPPVDDLRQPQTLLSLPPLFSSAPQYSDLQPATPPSQIISPEQPVINWSQYGRFCGQCGRRFLQTEERFCTRCGKPRGPIQ